MKKGFYKILLMSLGVLLYFATDSNAGRDSHTIPVSCSIPEIPGVNAPLIKEESWTTNNRQEIKKESKEEKPSENPTLLQEEKHNLYTFYAR